MKICSQLKIREQTYLASKGLQGKQELGTRTYDAANVRKELAHAINNMHEYLLSIVDHIGFEQPLSINYFMFLLETLSRRRFLKYISLREVNNYEVVEVVR